MSRLRFLASRAETGESAEARCLHPSASRLHT